MKKCPCCGKVQKEENQFCIGCGAKLETDFSTPEKEPRNKKPLLAMLTVVCVAVFVAAAVLLPRSGEIQQSPDPGQAFLPDAMEETNPETGSDDLVREEKLRQEEQQILCQQANLGNFGLVVPWGQGVCFSDYQRGLYYYEDGGTPQLLQEGVYFDLILQQDILYGLEMLGSDQYSVVRMDLKSREKQVLHEIQGASVVVGKILLDNKYYFCVDNDELFYLDLQTDQIVPTEYRNVVQVGTNGVFTADSSRLGLSYTSFDGKEQQYPQFSGKKVWVIYAGRKTAGVVVYEDPDNWEANFYVGFLDIQSGEIEKAIDKGDLQGYGYQATINILPGQNRYLISSIELENQDVYACLYLYDPEQDSLQRMDSIASDNLLLGAMAAGQTAYLVDPGSEARTMVLYDVSGSEPVKREIVAVKDVVGSLPTDTADGTTEDGEATPAPTGA